MESLLEKVQSIEAELGEHARNAHEKGRAELDDVMRAEPTVLEDVRARAEKRGQAIVREYVATTEAETNKMRQDEQQAVAAVHQQAQANRSQTVAFVLRLLEEEYL